MLNFVQLARIDLNLLVVFSAVYEEQHVGRAARRLKLTPSAISHAVRRLRDVLNDPLFVRTPRGVVPTKRANELAQPIGEILTRVHGVVAAAQPFDPSTSRRHFTIAVPEGGAEVVLIPLLTELARCAPGIDVSLVQPLPEIHGKTGNVVWQSTLESLDLGTFDVAVLPITHLPRRFETRRLYQEEFVVAMRRNHAYARRLTLRTFCATPQLLVSRSGDIQGFMDVLLAQRGLSRRVAVTVPNSMMALAVLAETDLIAVLPKRLMQRHARTFGLVHGRLPVKRAIDDVYVIATKAAMADAGVAFLLDTLANLEH